MNLQFFHGIHSTLFLVVVLSWVCGPKCKCTVSSLMVNPYSHGNTSSYQLRPMRSTVAASHDSAVCRIT